MKAKARLTHVALFVRDVRRTVDFYQHFAGLHLVHDRTEEGVRVAWLAEEPSDPHFVIVAIGVAPGLQGSPPPMAHFGFDLPSRDAVDAIGDLAQREGILDQPPKEGGPIVGYFCIVRDPDGNLVEFSHGQPITPAALRDHMTRCSR